jgi:UDP-N-acetylmuramoylalanine--D-glutamate ligase
LPQKLVILGSGESGTGAAILGMQQGFDVFVSDKGLIKPIYLQELDKRGIAYESGQHTEDRILEADLVVKSPGIPDKALLIQKLMQAGIPIISEIEFGWRYCKGKVLAITGSNGKTTTTSLLYHILQKEGLDVALGGNIGRSFARLVAEAPAAWYVLEVSSFQLDGCKSFRPHVAILCNITEDHLDRYNYQFELYIHSKLSIAGNQTADDFFIYNADDPVTARHLSGANIKARKVPISREQPVEFGGSIQNAQMIIQTDKDPLTMTIHDFALPGIHNSYNSMAAGVAAKVIGVRKETIRESLEDFKGIEHRLEPVTAVRGVRFINDSKATNVNSTWYALEEQTANVVWIVGGVDKGNDYTILKDLAREKVKAIICLGLDNEKLHKAFSEEVGYIVDANNMQAAVQMAYNISEPGDIVLLSPACASFDLFENYEDRGNQFKRYVRNL